MLGTPGVRGLHDLHVWEFLSGKIALSAHIKVDASLAREERLEDRLGAMLAARFGITHATVQVELPSAHGGSGPHAAWVGASRPGGHGHDHGGEHSHGHGVPAHHAGEEQSPGERH
ncbi:MAG TPA: hypothetical protein VNZ61_24035 [Roseomonas sp.]|nr:hypothetical protein [Roseomonas sp.]